LSAPTSVKVNDDVSSTTAGRVSRLAVDNSGNIYLVWHTGNGGYDLYSSKSTDGGATWSASVRINEVVGKVWLSSSPGLTMDSSGNLYTIWIDNRNVDWDKGHIYFAKSTDGGATWSANVDVSNNPDGTGTVYALGLVVDGSGNLSAAWGDSRNGHWDVYFAQSTDGGANWSAGIRVNDDNTVLEQYQASLAIDRNDNIHAAWADERNGNFDIYTSGWNYTTAQSCNNLTLGHTGDGSDPTASPSNSDGCAAGTYKEGENITLSGVSPATGWQVGSWTGTDDDPSTASTNTVTMPAADHTASVNYSQIEYTLTVISEHGTVTEFPDDLSYHYGDVVQLTANADAGWTFSSWIGCTGTGNTCSVTMDGDKIVTATYTEVPPPPTLPSNFYGEIHFSDNPPTAGQLVEAYIEGISGPAATVAIKGAAPLTYVIKITGDLPGTPTKEGGAEGDLITFKINGRVVATGMWHNGTINSLDFHPPQALTGDPYSGDEGSAISFSGSANDLGTDATTYQWDWDNDGIYDEAGQTLSHTWTNGGTYTVGLKVTDAQEGVGTATVTVNVNDVPPTNVNAGGPYNGTAGQPVALSGSATCVSVDTCTFAWDLDGDAEYNDATGTSASYTWNTIADYVIGLQVTDDDGNLVTGAASVHITGATHNITLVPGWNLVSFNLHPTNTSIANVLSSLVGNYDLVYAWDATGAHSTSGNWMKFAPSAPSYSNSLINLDEKMGFWIHMTSADTLDVVGNVPVTTNIAISDNAGGWNLVAYPSAEDGALPAVLVDHGVGTDFSIVYAYHANETADPWKLFGRTVPAWANDLTEFAPGWGYWVKATADNTWHVEYVTP
jgi:hypothetical protein